MSLGSDLSSKHHSALRQDSLNLGGGSNRRSVKGKRRRGARGSSGTPLQTLEEEVAQD
jgi:hypothetical protein